MPAAIPLIVAGVSVAGVGMSAYGMNQQQKAASNMQSSQQDMVRQEQAAEAQRQQAMELDARRRMLQQVRQGNVARATALSAATGDGAAFGSGLQGAYGNISGQENTNLTGISQNLQIGRSIFGINSNITQDRLDYSNAQGGYMSGGAMMSLGGKMVALGPTIGNVGGSLGSFFGGMGGGSRISNGQGYYGSSQGYTGGYGGFY